MSDVTHEAALYFWAIGDMHYRAMPAWHEVHTQRLQAMFTDLRALWQEEGMPAFCGAPGDLVETCAPANYELARTCLTRELGDVPFYPGVGNHEFHGPDGEDPATMLATFQHFWQRPPRYTWQAGGITCIMLDYPDPHTLQDPAYVYVSRETLAFLDETLMATRGKLAVIFFHAPLRNTVLDRDPVVGRDYNSMQNFFSPENSQAVRDILARHDQACIFISGHTHTGWEAPGLVKSEQLGQNMVTFVNLMSPWYTGNQDAIRVDREQQTVTYVPDEPDVMVSFAFYIRGEEALIRAREHRSQCWLKEWRVPML